MRALLRCVVATAISHTFIDAPHSNTSYKHPSPTNASRLTHISRATNQPTSQRVGEEIMPTTGRTRHRSMGRKKLSFKGRELLNAGGFTLPKATLSSSNRDPASMDDGDQSQREAAALSKSARNKKKRRMRRKQSVMHKEREKREGVHSITRFDKKQLGRYGSQAASGMLGNKQAAGRGGSSGGSRGSSRGSSGGDGRSTSPRPSTSPTSTSSSLSAAPRGSAGRSGSSRLSGSRTHFPSLERREQPNPSSSDNSAASSAASANSRQPVRSNSGANAAEARRAVEEAEARAIAEASAQAQVVEVSELSL